MHRPSLIVAPLHTLTPGQYADFYALLAERTKSATRDGKPYYACRFRDAQRTASCMVWADSDWYKSCDQEWREGQIYKLRAVYQEHERYGPQIELHNIRPVNDADRAEGFDPSQVAEASRFPVDAMFGELLALVKQEIRDEPLRRLVLNILDRHGQALRELPASEKQFYPFRGGWLEHVLSVTKTCRMLADHYIAHYSELKPPLNRDLLLAGAVLHDVGRALEFGFDLGVVQPTVPGKLFGHLLLGRDVIRDAAREVENLNPELLQLLEHLVLTHLSLPEWGSPRLPLIPEAILLHHADDLDAKLEMYARCLSRDTGAGPFTARDPILGKPLLKQRTV